jgi:Trypsin-like peptidase domain
MIFDGQEWNEAEIADRHLFNRGIISIIAFDTDNSPTVIGTGFVVQANGSSAIAITAAHNFEGVRKVLQPIERHHPTALPEFLDHVKVSGIDPKRVRALCVDESGIDLSIISWAAWDTRADIGVFSVTHQFNDAQFFKTRFLLSDSVPNIGEDVALMGLADMEVSERLRDGNWLQEFAVTRRRVLRCGRVSGMHLDGHMLCKGPCIETSIPVFPGMSGGPAFYLGKEGEAILPFGVVSSDFLTDREKRYDRSTPGSSIIALLGATFEYVADGTKLAVLKLNVSQILSEDRTG